MSKDFFIKHRVQIISETSFRLTPENKQFGIDFPLRVHKLQCVTQTYLLRITIHFYQGQ